MINSADNFKPSINKLTEYRIRSVMKYIIYCYQKTLADKKRYDYSKRGRVAHEDFLRNGIVNDYLSKTSNKQYFKEHISDNPSVELTFHPEETKTYIDPKTEEERNDKIDISIYESGLQSLWSQTTDDEIKFAVECKRINGKDDCKEYVKDIKKFTERPQTTFRLPIEGQMAFIENGTAHNVIAQDVNNLLDIDKDIETTLLLTSENLHHAVNCTYLSKHKKNYGANANFSIFHLLLDYSQIVIPT